MPQALPTQPQNGIKRDAKGRITAGSVGHLGGDAGRARRALNTDTIREMHLAFRAGGRKAIDKVMRNQPAVFLKLLVLLVPRELEVTHSGGVKGLSDDQLESAITAIRDMLAAREAKTIQGVATPLPLPSPDADVGRVVGRKRGRPKKVMISTEGGG